MENELEETKEIIFCDVTVPLKVEELKNFIEKKDKFYLINYKNSELRDGIFLNYISNLDLPCEIVLKDSSYEEKANLLAAYLSSKNIVNIESLACNIANTLLEFRGIDTSDVFTDPALNKEETQRFIKENEEQIIRWEQFLESTVVFALYIMKELDKENDIKSQVPHIDDSNYVGLNVVSLMKVPIFMELFFLTGTRRELSFFTRQFEEYMFKGANLFHYYHSENNPVYGLMLAKFEGVVDNELLDDVLNEAYSIEPPAQEKPADQK